MKFPAFDPIDLRNNIEAFEIIELPLFNIVADENQPRKNFDLQALNELAFSIKQHGIIQPIIVKKIDVDKYQIIAGERRWRAAKLAKLSAIPAIIQSYNEQQNLAIALIENIQREELNPIELAETFHRLHSEHGLSHKTIATMVGKSRATVTNLLRLLDLPKSVRNLLIDGKLEMGHARALLSSSLDQQEKLAQEIAEKNLTVRDVEKRVQFYKNIKANQHEYRFSGETDKWMRKLANHLSLKVEVKVNKRGKGRVIIHINSLDDIDQLIEPLVEKV